MNQKLLLLAVLLIFPFLQLTTSAATSFPDKDPVISYVTPKTWASELDKDDSLSISSKSGRVVVTFGEAPAAASLEALEQMLPAMIKILQNPVEADKAKEHSEAGLTGYTATYTGKIEDKPATVIFVLFEGGKKRSILGNMILIDPETMPKNDDAAFKEFMHSLTAAGASEKPDKPAGKTTAGSFPKKRPALTYEVPGDWTTEVDDDGSISINAESERISINFSEIPAAASMELFEQMLPEMVKEIDNAKVAKEKEEHTADGLTGFTATYSGTIEDTPMTAIFVLFKAGKERSILACMFLEDLKTLPKEDSAAFGSFMKSLKGIKK